MPFLLVPLGILAVCPVASVFIGLRWPDMGQATHLPWWACTGGSPVRPTVLFSAEKLGAAVFTGLHRHGRDPHLRRP